MKAWSTYVHSLVHQMFFHVPQNHRNIWHAKLNLECLATHCRYRVGKLHVNSYDCAISKVLYKLATCTYVWRAYSIHSLNRRQVVSAGVNGLVTRTL